MKANTDKRPGDLLTPDDKKKLTDNFVGYDIDPAMVRISRVNMYLHGFQQPHIYEHDTLTNESRWQEQFDVIMANPPFMTPKGGIRPHKLFSIHANRSEVLFVDYIAEHLAINGRAGVIVPEGIIFQSANAYKNLRKMLIDNYLWAVVSLPAGVFQPYSGVKTSILFMDKKLAKQTDNILFVKIENDGFDLGAQRRPIDKNGLPLASEVMNFYKESAKENKELQLPEEYKKLAHIVPKQKIIESGDYNLIGDRYKETISITNQKWPMVELGEICEIQTGARERGGAIDNGIPSIGGEQITEDGRIKQEKMKYISENFFNQMKKGILQKNDVLIVKDGATTGKTAFYEGIYDKAAVNEHVYILRANKKILPYFLFYIVRSENFQTALKYYVKGIIGGISSEIKHIKIPLPPLEVQNKL